MPRYKSVHTGPQIDSGVARALPGGEIDATLAGKADILTPIPSGVTSCNNLPDGLYLCSSDMLTDCPISTFNGKIFVSLQSRYFQWAIDAGLRQVWYRTDGGGGWGDWTPIATATPPTEHDLPLYSGFSKNVTAIYFKTQDGIVHCCGSVIGTFPANTATQFAAFQAGFMPKNITAFPASWRNADAGTLGAALIDITPDAYGGYIEAVPSGDAQCIYFSFTFEAES